MLPVFLAPFLGLFLLWPPPSFALLVGSLEITIRRVGSNHLAFSMLAFIFLLLLTLARLVSSDSGHAIVSQSLLRIRVFFLHDSACDCEFVAARVQVETVVLTFEHSTVREKRERRREDDGLDRPKAALTVASLLACVKK
jgi:hypothetical protein